MTLRLSLAVSKLLVPLAFVLLALSSALYVLFDQKGSDAEECEDFRALGGGWAAWHSPLFMLVNSAMDGESQGALLLCVLHEDPSWFLAWVRKQILSHLANKYCHV